MPNIVRSQITTTTDDRKTVRVLFTPQVPNPATQSNVEVIFEVTSPETVSPNAPPVALVLLSSTLVDTREPYPLSTPQKDAVIQAALSTITDEIDNSNWP